MNVAQNSPDASTPTNADSIKDALASERCGWMIRLFSPHVVQFCQNLCLDFVRFFSFCCIHSNAVPNKKREGETMKSVSFFCSIHHQREETSFFSLGHHALATTKGARPGSEAGGGTSCLSFRHTFCSHDPSRFRLLRPARDAAFSPPRLLSVDPRSLVGTKCPLELAGSHPTSLHLLVPHNPHSNCPPGSFFWTFCIAPPTRSPAPLSSSHPPNHV